MRDTKKMLRIFDLSVKEVEEVLSNKKTISEKTKISIASLGVYSRLKSAEVHEMALKILMQRHKIKAIEA